MVDLRDCSPASAQKAVSLLCVEQVSGTPRRLGVSWLNGSYQLPRFTGSQVFQRLAGFLPEWSHSMASSRAPWHLAYVVSKKAPYRDPSGHRLFCCFVNGLSEQKSRSVFNLGAACSTFIREARGFSRKYGIRDGGKAWVLHFEIKHPHT